MAWPCSSVSWVSVGSFVSPSSGLHSVGPCRLPSRGVASTRHPDRFYQSKSGNFSAPRCRIIAAASVNDSGVAHTLPSSKVVLSRQVTIVDLGLVSPNVATRSGPVVGSVSGRHPQQWPSSLHCVLRLRGGASSSSSSDDGAATTFGHDGRVDDLLPDF